MPRPCLSAVNDMSGQSGFWPAPGPDLASRPHHHGHRERLRARAAQGLGPLPDYELLELLLFRSLPQGDVKPLAKTLLTRFGTLAGVLSARMDELKTIKGV